MSVEITAKYLTTELERLEVYLNQLTKQLEQEQQQFRQRELWNKQRLEKEAKNPGYYATKMRALRAKRAAEEADRERERLLLGLPPVEKRPRGRPRKESVEE